jgi:hypothetical protein
MAPPPAPALLPPALALSDGPPDRFLKAPRTAHVWRAALARAPPRSA